jgi:tripartite-type tricarboxylate transporter receptor subunit TctC
MQSRARFNDERPTLRPDRAATPRSLNNWWVRHCVAVLATFTLAGAAQAEFPDRPIKWIVPAAAGGGADGAVRVVADQLSRRLGQPVVIDNRPGASGAIGLDAVAKSAPDGYTVGTANITNFVLNRQLRPNLPFDPDRDLVPVAKLTTQPNLLVVTPSLPVKNVKELIAYAKATPQKLFYGSTGPGSSLHVAGEALKQAAGIDMVHVPYKSAPTANTDLMANSIQVLIDNLSTLAPHVRTGKVKPLAVTSPHRSPQLPQIPTIVEAGGPDFQMMVWGGVVAPKGIPAEALKRLSDEILAVMALPEVKARLATLGYEPDPLGPVAFGAFIQKENQHWGDVIRRAGIKAE